MDTATLIVELKACLEQISTLKKIKEGIHHPHVKAWRSRTLELLKSGGAACIKAHASLASMQFISDTFEDTFVGQQSYLNQHEAMERILSQTIMTLEVFGRPEDKEPMPSWTPPNRHGATGKIVVGEHKVGLDQVSIEETLSCFVEFVKASNSLTEEMRQRLIEHVERINSSDLYRPFLQQKLDAMFSFWPKTYHKRLKD
jgi:hypothetical protein